jgi:hypothetical protein
LPVEVFGNVITALAEGGVADPVSRSLGWPGKPEVGTAEIIVRVSVPLPVIALLPVPYVALMVTLNAPTVVGVPEITPVVVFTLKPLGKPVAL